MGKKAASKSYVNNMPTLSYIAAENYRKKAVPVSKIIMGGPDSAITRIGELKQYENVITDYCERLWENYLVRVKGDQFDTLHKGAGLSRRKLKSNGEIPEIMLTNILEELSHTTLPQERYPFRLEDLTEKLIKAPKTIIAETAFNGVGKHKRPCFVIRRLLKCTINGEHYLLMADETYHQNTPKVCCPLYLLYGGNSEGICQIGRFDTIGHHGPQPQLNYHLPQYIIDVFENTHSNIIKPKSFKNSLGNKVESEVCCAHHQHKRDRKLETLFCASHFVSGILGKSDPTKFLKFNASSINLRDYYKLNDDDTDEIIDGRINADIENNNGLISTTYIQNYFAKTFNIVNYEHSPLLAYELDKIREYDPKKQVEFIDTNIVPERKGYTNYKITNESLDRNIIEKVESGRYLDWDQAKPLLEAELLEKTSKPELLAKFATILNNKVFDSLNNGSTPNDGGKPL